MHQQAMVNERADVFPWAFVYRVLALYIDWGAKAKVDNLDEQCKQVLANFFDSFQNGCSLNCNLQARYRLTPFLHIE